MAYRYIGSAAREHLDTEFLAKLLEERGIDESRHGSRARPRPCRAFFSDSSSLLELDEVFQILQILELDLAE